MQVTSHTFHIPVMGLGYTIDTPIKVARYGISSVISIVQDDVIEKARKYYSGKNGLEYSPIPKTDPDHRCKRITAYLNLVKHLVDVSFEDLKNTPQELTKYARLLPGDISPEFLVKHIDQLTSGSIDVNIMTKLDRAPSSEDGVLTEACSALKGFADSKLDSSVVLSAGLNPRLFTFMEQFNDFFPNSKGSIKKKIIVKVSDFRSAAVQGKILAKKGLWVSEYRIESGLNCGGHTFATEGLLIGPILEEFKSSRKKMFEEQEALCKEAWKSQGRCNAHSLKQRITVQGGLGTSEERELLETYYNVDATGWGSPFLLVPEATSVDDTTLKELAEAREKDIYNSDISPLGVSFNTIRNNTGEKEKLKRVSANKPGSPCLWKHLALDTSHSPAGICTASRKYQDKKIKELKEQNLDSEIFDKEYAKITEKECICHGLTLSFLKHFDLEDEMKSDGVSVCPGPNLAYFDRTYSLEEMVGQIYGKTQVISLNRPHMLIKELSLYIDHYEKMKKELNENPSPKLERRLNKFRSNLIAGIDHYKELSTHLKQGEHLDFVSTLESYDTILRLEATAS